MVIEFHLYEISALVWPGYGKSSGRPRSVVTDVVLVVPRIPPSLLAAIAAAPAPAPPPPSPAPTANLGE